MHRTGIISLSSLIVAGALAGCGSSGGHSAAASSSSSGSSSTATSGSSAYAQGSGSSSSGSTPYRYGGGSSSGAPSATTAALITTKHDKLGTILAYGSKKLTVYMFEADHGASSSCSAACAQVWPPVTGTPKALAGVDSAELGTIKRSDGTTQVTYKGHPLYLYVKDQDDGDTYGEGVKSFGAAWYALKPSGAMVDES